MLPLYQRCFPKPFVSPVGFCQRQRYSGRRLREPCPTVLQPGQRRAIHLLHPVQAVLNVPNAGCDGLLLSVLAGLVFVVVVACHR